MLSALIASSANPLADLSGPDLHLRWLLLAALSALTAWAAWAHSRYLYGTRLWWMLGAGLSGLAAVVFFLVWLAKLLGPLAQIAGGSGLVALLFLGWLYFSGSRPSRG